MGGGAARQVRLYGYSLGTSTPPAPTDTTTLRRHRDGQTDRCGSMEEHLQVADGESRRNSSTINDGLVHTRPGTISMVFQDACEPG